MRLRWIVVLVLVGGVVACGPATDDADDIEVGRRLAENRQPGLGG